MRPATKGQRLGCFWGNCIPRGSYCEIEAAPLAHFAKSGSALVFVFPSALIWRRRVEVESTIRPAKGRIAGFEGREGHRTPFAPVIARLSDYRLYSTYPTCASSATGGVARERFPAARHTTLWGPRGFLQRLKPIRFRSFTPGLKLRPPKEENFPQGRPFATLPLEDRGKLGKQPCPLGSHLRNGFWSETCLSRLFWSEFRGCTPHCDEPHSPVTHGSLYNASGPSYSL